MERGPGQRAYRYRKQQTAMNAVGGSAPSPLAAAEAGPRPLTVQPDSPIFVRAQDCLRRNVSRVVRVESDIDAAANFLVNYACAGEIAQAARYEANVSMVNAFLPMLNSTSAAFGKAPTTPSTDASNTPRRFSPINATVDAQTGDIVVADAPPGTTPNFFGDFLSRTASASATSAIASHVPVFLRRLAGELVLTAVEQKPRLRR